MTATMTANVIEHKQLDVEDRIGVVVIGRNEAARLRTCLDAVLAQAPRANVVYVDSGSDDESVEIARCAGVAVLELSRKLPFSAARARNEGFRFLQERNDSIELVQFVDGDCELKPGWIAHALEAIHEHDRIAIVCGTLRERYPDRSIYNRLCAIEWARELGEIRWCGGIFMVRSDAFSAVDGFRISMIAGEEPELCGRLRRAGWSIVRVRVDMAVHDADMMRFRQWWNRSARAGYAWADRAVMEGIGRGGAALRQVASILVWALLLPATIALSAWFTQGLTLLLLAAYPALAVKIAFARWRRGLSAADSALFALFTIPWKFAALRGVIRYAMTRLMNRSPQLLEHKQPAAHARGAS